MKLRDDILASQAHKLLDGIGHEAVGLYMAVERKLASVAAPDVSWSMGSVETGLLRGLFGRRDFLVIEYGRSEYRVLISSRPFGTALQVSWFLIATPRLANEFVRALRLTVDKESRFDLGSELTTLEMMDLNAFVSLTRLALNSALSELTGDDAPQVVEANETPELE